MQGSRRKCGSLDLDEGRMWKEGRGRTTRQYRMKEVKRGKVSLEQKEWEEGASHAKLIQREALV